MKEIELSADELVSRLLVLSESQNVCLLDSCGVSHLGSHLLIAGIRPVEMLEISDLSAAETLAVLDKKLTAGYAAIFTLSYDLGNKLNGIAPTQRASEPDLFIALYDSLIVHDYDTGKTFASGSLEACSRAIEMLGGHALGKVAVPAGNSTEGEAEFAFTRAHYLATVERVRELIRLGVTYQTNLTQQIRIRLGSGVSAARVFSHLRRDHPAPFAAFLHRLSSTVVSASPERFFKVVYGKVAPSITASPIKGTRARGRTAAEDARLRRDLLHSGKDRAENTMIVDLTRNDLGRICEFGTVRVETLCELEEHPTLMHLVSTVTGTLKRNLAASEILRAMFPCGSITGAPKLSTMRIINTIEPAARGLSMGSIGCSIPEGFRGLVPSLELSVAIRTMVIANGEAMFNVGGGIVYDSDPDNEYEESMLKAVALLRACGVAEALD